MDELKVTKELMEDTYNLVNDFGIFMSFNLIKQDGNVSGKAKTEVLALLNRSNSDYGKLKDLFTLPVMNNYKKNSEMLTKSFPTIVKTLYEYLIYAEPLVKQYLPEIYKGRFSSIKKNYTAFSKKHLNT